MGFGLVRYGGAWSGTVILGVVWFSSALFGRVWQGFVIHGLVGYCEVGLGTA